MFLAGILRLLVYAILAYVILSIIKGIAASGARKPTPPSRPSGPDTLVKDEICGTYLPRRDAVRDVVDGRERFFCSRECRKKAKAGADSSR
ncbi:MAG: hypothetical protein MUQ00_12480 [Candidatus Aminicenantes bacterium]|nr:hypothetical protein [Candidatus Aminicenantes bacterium]